MISARTFQVTWLISAILLAVPKSAYSETGIEAITNPSADVTLSFVQPGRIAKVYLKEGDAVKAGQLLAQQDDAVEQAQLAQIEAQSQNTAQIEAGEASLEQKRVDLRKLEWAAKRNAATELEVAHAKLDVKIAELSLKVAQFEHEQDKRKYNEAKIRVENMSLKSPIDGKIEKIHVEVGESVNVLADVVRVVKIDPLWLDVYVPLDKAKTLRFGQTAKVKFPDAKEIWTEGRIIYIAAVADAASGTLRIRIEVPNKSNRPAGEHVRVFFPTSQ